MRLDLQRRLFEPHTAEQLTNSPCLQLNGADEEAEFDQLHLQITERLARIVRSIAPND